MEEKLVKVSTTKEFAATFLNDIFFRMAVNRVLEAAPAADAVEVVHARWERTEHHGFLRCSKCNDVYISDEWVEEGKWNYCPNCGALMDGRNNVPRTDGDGNA